MLTNTNRIWDKNSGVCGSENPIFDLVLGLKQEIIRILIKGPHCKEEHSVGGGGGAKIMMPVNWLINFIKIIFRKINLNG